MPARNSAARAPLEDLIVTRVFDAPRELVFRAWTDPLHLMQWFAPPGCTTPHCTVDLRVGGSFHFCMRFPGGREIWGQGIYREIEAPARIAYMDSFADAAGTPVAPSHYGMSAGHPAESLVTVTFTEHRGRTTVILRHALPPSFEERAGMEQGWLGMVKRLAGYLAQR